MADQGHIIVIGAGALGSWFAAAMTQAGLDVTLIARGARLAHLAKHGVALDRGSGAQNLCVAVAENCTNLPPPSLVLLCTKAGDMADAMNLLSPFRKLPFTLVTVQNGVEAPQQAQQALPAATIIAARVHGFFEMAGQVVRHVGVEPSIAFGALEQKAPRHEAHFAACLSQAGIAHDRPADMASALWEKFLLASAVGAVGAALGVSAGQLKDSPQHWALLEAAMREIAALAAARGIKLAPDCVEVTLDFVAGFPADATSSLQRDLTEGRPSEYDQLPGAVLRLAADCGMEAPVFTEIAQMLHARGLLLRQ